MILQELTRLVLTGRRGRYLLPISGLVVLIVSSVVSADLTEGTWQVGHQKPIREHRLHGEGGPKPPSTLAALWGMSELVVEGALVGLEPADVMVRLDDGSTSTFIQTMYEFRVVSEIKADSRLSGERGTLRVLRAGGERDRGDRVDLYVDDTFGPFEENDTILLFLKQAPNGDWYLPATDGGDSAFRIADGVAVPLGRSELSRSIHRRTRGEIMAILRALKGGR